MSRGLIVILSLIGLSGAYLGWDLYSESQAKGQKEKDMKIVSFPMDQIQELNILNQDRNLKIKRSSEGWDLIEPIQDQADFEEVESYISAASYDSAIAVVDEGKNINWGMYGLENPKLSVEFVNNHGDKLRIWISDKNNFEGHSYIRIGDEDRVLTANSSWYSKSQKTALDFRDKRILKRKLAGIDQIQIENKNGTWSLKNTEGQWTVLGKETWQIDQEKARQVMKEISDARVLDVLWEDSAFQKTTQGDESKITEKEALQNAIVHFKKFGLDQPILSLRAQFQDEIWSVRLSQKTKEDFYLWTSTPNRIYQVDAALLRSFQNLKASEMRDFTLPFQFSKDPVSKILIQTQLKTTELKLENGQWSYQGDTKQVQQDLVKALIEGLRQSVASDYLGAQGLESQMTNVIRLFSAKDEVLFEVKWEPKGAGQKLKAKSQSFSETFLWASGEIEKLKLSELIVNKAKD